MASKTAPQILYAAAIAAYYEKTGEPDKAGQYYAKAVLIDPQSKIARRNYANFLYRYGYYQESTFYSANLRKYH